MTNPRERIRNYREWGFACPEVGPADFLSESDAGRVLAVSPGQLRTLLFLRKIDPCASVDGDVGFTRASVEAELLWRRDASRFARIGRSLEILAKTLLRAF
jgi:hypothetical protein